MTHHMDSSISINKEQMDPYMKATHTKRFVVEDSITKVTSDGEPHEMMTMIAGLSGLFAAMVILAVLISLVSCKSGKKAKHCKNCPRINNGQAAGFGKRPCSLDENSTRSSISTTYTRAVSLEEGTAVPATPVYNPSVSVISTGNLSGNLNSAFMASEVNLTNSLSKPKKKTHWSDEVDAQLRSKETAVDIERF
ncbi:uncharacterized protein LOC105664457 [Ceratitis capitata]|uniref:Uncharacterized protein n=1 Tax=Ceratitis capitata TaxID=7213 RepID=W8ARE4_CERCA|nr:uncharacterized protein LOC105664457 [Ceratitis capitata]XP_020715416.1 uncharacterized protein LOC105664457 [Ceratitis capitata]XP_020715417.1 uncharacterized protein LOC105664457 [Ceratitis capitata]